MVTGSVTVTLLFIKMRYGVFILPILFSVLAEAVNIPDFGFNLDPLGVSGTNLDFHDTSTRFFAGT